MLNQRKQSMPISSVISFIVSQCDRFYHITVSIDLLGNYMQQSIQSKAGFWKAVCLKNGSQLNWNTFCKLLTSAAMFVAIKTTRYLPVNKQRIPSLFLVACKVSCLQKQEKVRTCFNTLTDKTWVTSIFSFKIFFFICLCRLGDADGSSYCNIWRSGICNKNKLAEGNTSSPQRVKMLCWSYLAWNLSQWWRTISDKKHIWKIFHFSHIQGHSISALFLICIVNLIPFSPFTSIWNNKLFFHVCYSLVSFEHL